MLPVGGRVSNCGCGLLPWKGETAKLEHLHPLPTQSTWGTLPNTLYFLFSMHTWGSRALASRATFFSQTKHYWHHWCTHNWAHKVCFFYNVLSMRMMRVETRNEGSASTNEFWPNPPLIVASLAGLEGHFTPTSHHFGKYVFGKLLDLQREGKRADVSMTNLAFPHGCTLG